GGAACGVILRAARPGVWPRRGRGEWQGGGGPVVSKAPGRSVRGAHRAPPRGAGSPAGPARRRSRERDRSPPRGGKGAGAPQGGGVPPGRPLSQAFCRVERLSQAPARPCLVWLGRLAALGGRGVPAASCRRA